jgi:type I restriction enzyme S subunit
MVRDAAQLMGHFHLLAEAPGGVARVRQLVLELAVRGRLVAQDSSDEPASVLLARIAAERADLVKEKKLPKSDPLPPVREEEQPFSLPTGWAWARVGTAGVVQLGRQRSPDNHNGPKMRPYLRVANVHENRIDVRDVLSMNFTDDEFERFKLVSGDVLLNEGQSYELVGRPALYRDEAPGACFQNSLIRFRALQPMPPEFALIVFRAYLHNGRFRREAQQTTNIAHLSAGRLAVIEFPVPPFAEQRRIVAKVDELMAWCDQMEQGIATRDARRTVARDATLTAVSRAAAPRDAWKRAEANWSTLVHSADDVPTLRRVVLDLAVRGQLVAQDASDEPASVLLTRIAAERADLVKEKKLPKRDPLPPVREEEQPFVLPAGWAWARIGSLCDLRNGRAFKPEDWSAQGLKIIRIQNLNNPAAPYNHFEGAIDHRHAVASGDLLFSWSGTPGTSFGAYLWDRGDAVLNQHIFRVDYSRSLLDRSYFRIAMNSRLDHLIEIAHGGVGLSHVTRPVIDSTPIPVAPLAEQQRIVAKVDALMALCDRLEASARTQREAHTAVAAMLGRAVAAS